ncbi:hypothetical protein ABB37_03539 [Leptomonas pyrrhocoris]|uniref:Uncharacterized protein n=1 Tax=Leptomonas pyrrhocoris TaxID=157538 RepID=A0A0M9G4X0_LEPPY|nr:hypothetical protein ABB37_03539 [Leptomonas pyrrhocoris]KPA82480.1 hypothetical protein ABB37_03539 [Leptomonas pyrrhocoris]|eukprot:XP_015660919.1 hypothetical protein ABB37_03539 [Leptomonas pyrrhocoris]
MEGQRRFSAAPVNFDRFVSLNRSQSRSLSPNNELHQMLRPYESRPTAASRSGHRKTTSTALLSASSASSSSHPLKVERRSIDMLNVPSSGVVTIEGPSTQAATPPSRSASGGAGTTSTGISMEVGAPAETRSELRYYNSEDDTAELERSQFVVEEVDVLLRAVQQLGSPLYNAVTRQFLCWNLHTLEARSRASYGDTEGISCDFCGHTDWLDSLVDGEEQADDSAEGIGELSEVKKEEGEKKGGHAALPAHRRFLYHCPVCKVDICRACLAEVLADERFHVPCLQCQRCGAYETRRNAPLHQCTGTTGWKEEGELGEIPSWIPRPKEEAPALPAEAVTLKKLAGVTAIRSHVRLGLSRRRDGDGATVAAETAREAAVITRKDSSTGHPPAVQPVSSSSSSFLSSSAVAAPTRKRPSATRSTTTTNVRPRATLEEQAESDDGDDLPVKEIPPQQQQQRRRRPGALSSRESRVKAPASSNSSLDAPQAQLLRLQQQQQSSVLSTARYEVHLAPQSSDEEEEVRRISREQHLLLIPAPSVGGTSVAYFPTRLAAESCVDRATVGSVEAVLKRHSRQS